MKENKINRKWVWVEEGNCEFFEEQIKKKIRRKIANRNEDRKLRLCVSASSNLDKEDGKLIIVFFIQFIRLTIYSSFLLWMNLFILVFL